MMNILFTLCGRAGSKGFKNKNLKDFCGAPLVYYSLAAINNYIEENNDVAADIVLNTDSLELIDIVRKQSVIDVDVIEREKSLGGDTVPKVSVIFDCVDKMIDRKRHDYDMVVDLDITSPLRTVVDVANAIRKKAMRPEVDVVYSVTDARRNPYFNMVREEAGFFTKAVASEYTARQQAPVMYDMNASIYAYSVEALKNKNHSVFFNDNCDAIIMKDTGILDIDSEEDYELMQVIAEYLYDKYSEFGSIRETAILIKQSVN